MFQDESTLRVDICGRLADDRRQLAAARHRSRQMIAVAAVHIVLEKWQSAPLNQLRASLRAAGALIDELGVSQLQLSGAPLLSCGHQQHHLPLQFVDNAVVGAASSVRDKTLLVSIDPVYAGNLIDKSHYLNGRAYGIFELARRLRYRCIGVVSVEEEFERTQAHLVVDALGSSRASAESVYRAYLLLYSDLHLIVDTSGKPLHCDNTATLEDRNPAVVKVPDEDRRPNASSASIVSARALVSEVRAANILNGLELVELALVATGVKSSMRTTIAQRGARKIGAMLSAHGLSYRLNCEQHRYSVDRGKGGWSNLYKPALDGDAYSNERMLYIATTARQAAQSAAAEHDSDQRFGEALSYPACCRASFERNLPRAIRHQGDLTPLIADQTLESGPWPFLLNTAARYFHYQIVSYYPCSYVCVEAVRQAREYFQVICDVMPEWGREVATVMASPALYTEYRGVYIFVGARVTDNCITYSGDSVRMTTYNSLGRDISASDALAARGPGEVALYRGGKFFKVLRDTNIRLMPFGGWSI